MFLLFVSFVHRIDRRNCILAAAIDMPKTVIASDTKPAAAADASKWPIADFKEVHETDRGFPAEGLSNAPTTAPTW